jgi:hypothetical protein
VLVVGGQRYLQSKEKSNLFFAVMIAAILLLYAFRVISILEVGDVIGGVAIVSWVYFMLVRNKVDYTKALLYAGFVQILYALFRTIALGRVFEERVEAIFTGYESIMGSSLAGSPEAMEQMLPMIEQMKAILLNYQGAIWALTMLLSMYAATLIFARRVGDNWEHKRIRFPFWVSYLLIGAMLFAVFSATRTLGINGMIMLSVFFLIQGLAIIDYWTNGFMKKNSFVMVGMVILMIINVFFAISVALLGLIDYWLDMRKINQ